MSNKIYKDKGTNFAAMVIDLARMYQRQAQPDSNCNLAYDVLVAVHEGALGMDTTGFDVNLDPNEFSFIDIASGEVKLSVWSHRGIYEDEIIRGTGERVERGVAVNIVREENLDSMFGDYGHVVHSIIGVDAELDILAFKHVTTFTFSRENEQPVTVAIFKD